MTSLQPIDVHDMLGHPGDSRRSDVLGTIEGLATELVAVPDDAPLGGSLLLESVVEGILASGSITGTWTVRCARCLTERQRPFTVNISELFAEDMPDAGSDEIDDDDRYALVEGTSTSNRRSVTPSASRCRSRPCASPIAWGCARSAASRRADPRRPLGAVPRRRHRPYGR